MIYFDTNLLIYKRIKAIDNKKHSISFDIVNEAIEKEHFLISPLTLLELIFVLKKLKLTSKQINNDINFYKYYCFNEIDKELVLSSHEIAFKEGLEKSINDIVHLKYAEKYCEKLITFDKGFDRLKKHTNIDILILE